MQPVEHDPLQFGAEDNQVGGCTSWYALACTSLLWHTGWPADFLQQHCLGPASWEVCFSSLQDKADARSQR